MSDSDLADLETSAILHDIGKNGVAESILSKPGKLDPGGARTDRETLRIWLGDSAGNSRL